MRYITNKWEKKDAVKNGGWYVAYGRELTETDIIAGAVATGISIFSSNPGPVIAWAENLLQESIIEMKKSLGQIGNEFGEEVQKRAVDLAIRTVKKLLQGKQEGVSDILSQGKIDFKAGVSEYNGENQAWDPLYGCSITNITNCGGYQTISKTWALAPYIAIRFVPAAVSFPVSDEITAKADSKWLEPFLSVAMEA